MPEPRGPGRPRKFPAATPVKVDDKAKPDDERIGREVHPDASGIGFDDGSQYRVENGVIVEKLN